MTPHETVRLFTKHKVIEFKKKNSNLITDTVRSGVTLNKYMCALDVIFTCIEDRKEYNFMYGYIHTDCNYLLLIFKVNNPEMLTWLNTLNLTLVILIHLLKHE